MKNKMVIVVMLVGVMVLTHNVVLAVPAVLVGPEINPANNHNYYLLEPSRWTEAENVAVSMGGHLVTINDEAENNWVVDTFNDYIDWGDTGRGGLWIGMNDILGNDVFEWVSGESITYENWSVDFPAFDSEDYCVIWNKLGEERTWNNTLDDNWLDYGHNYPTYGVVEVVPEPGLLEGLEIIGPDEVEENSNGQYLAIAHYDNGSTRDVTIQGEWWVEPGTYASIDGDGLVTTGDVEGDEVIAVICQYTEGGVTVEAEKQVTIFDICRSGSALDFDGQNDYVDMISSGPLGNSARSISVWAKTSRASSQFILSYGGTSGSPGSTFRAGLSAYGSCEGVTLDISFGAVTYSASVADGDWHHYTFVVPNKVDTTLGDVKVYQDGILLNNICASTSLNRIIETQANHPIDIGRYMDEQNHYFKGSIDEVAIYNRVLTAEEILDRMHLPLTGQEEGLVGYWSFDEGDGQIVSDLSGNGNNGQLGNGPDADGSDPDWVESDAPVMCLESLIGIEIEGPSEVAENSEVQYRAKAFYENGITMYVTHSADWLIEGGTYMSINEDGVLTTEEVHLPEEGITISVQYSAGDVTVSAEKEVSVFSICPGGSALDFDGVEDSVRVTDDSSLSFGSSTDFSIFCWAKYEPDGVKRWNILVDKRINTSTGYVMGINMIQNGMLIFRTSETVKSDLVVSDTEWHHIGVVVERDSDTVTFYLDNMSDTKTFVDGNLDCSADLIIGKRAFPEDNHFSGSIDEVAIYNRALSAEEVQGLLYKKPDVEDDGLVGYWDFDDG